MIKFTVKEQISTPVPTLFLKKYMCNAPEKYLKVYLYGVYLAHANEQPNEVQLVDVLGQTVAEINEALDYWGHKGFVRVKNTGKNTHYEFITNFEEIEIEGAPLEQKKPPVYENENYNNMLNTLLSRTLSAEELEKIYDFSEIYGLSQDVIISLIEYCTAERGKRVSVSYIDKVAQSWADEGISTREHAQEKIEEYKAKSGGAKKLMTIMGIHGKYPGKTELDLYDKWTQKWGFTHEAIAFVMEGREFSGGQPFKYLDAILRELYENGITASSKISEYYAQREGRQSKMKEVLSALEYSRIIISPKCERYYGEWESAGIIHSTVLLACAQSIKNGSRKLESVDAILKEWQECGLKDEEEIKKYLRKQNTIEKKIKQIYDCAGIKRNIGETEVKNYLRFTKEMGLSQDVLMFAAEISSLAKDPYTFMHKVLSDWAKSGVTTLDKAKAQNFNRFKNDLSQKRGFEQRQYSEEEFEKRDQEAVLELERLYAK